MSLAQISATSVLCQLLEREKPEVNGMTLLGGEYGNAGRDLLRERLLVVGASLSHVTCPECGVELARVVRDLAHENILLSCDECGEVNSPRSLQETYKVSLPKFIDRLMLGLGIQPNVKKEVATEVAWRIGVTEPVRGKPLTWYFARHLHDHRVAQRLVETIKQDQAHKSAKVLTSSALPLPEGSPLSDFDVVHLSDVARISQSKFEFFSDRMTVPVAAPVEDPKFRTTLRLVRTESKARVDGVDYALEPRQKDLLLALMDDFDREMDRDALRTACRSQADSFSPSKVFERIPVVYKQFIKYQSGDGVYALQIPEEDRDWLT
ncbi:TFIIB-type zinc ribbon-containing protein [Limnohabitans sp. 15K]|uniref:TFIIB-type zinc ribbon-containing protein n=1 Tax=Limnohabitans sp. 15K TaxID=1100706 RepID=UPI000C1EE47E|nr:TFIIB-type zinc ribbon-containing protein [Limnohabitans sp. 15K]PIT80148.1 hypothetical protein B9Z40_16115 [Limnohabitans sp. 15K]